MRTIALTSLLLVSHASSAHLLGIAWKDLGNHTVRFYAETAHTGVTEVGGGALQIGPWSTREYHEWTGLVTGATFEELAIDGMAYWDFDDANSTLNEGNYSTHAVAPGTYGNFFFVDVPDFVSGEYLLTAESRSTALDRPVSYTYLTARISVPEPPIFVLLAMGLLMVFVPRVVKQRSK